MDKFESSYNKFMKKVLIADLVKASQEEQLKEDQRLADLWNVTLFELECMKEISPNEADWDDIIATAESLNSDICDITEDDVWNYVDMGRENKGELESTVGPIQWLYDNKAKVYIVYMIVTTMSKPRDIIYNIEPDVMKEWINSESMGEYWNEFIRSNSDIEDAAKSSDFPIGGCNANPLDPSVVRRFNTRFVAIS